MADVTISGAGAHSSVADTDRFPASKGAFSPGTAGYHAFSAIKAAVLAVFGSNGIVARTATGTFAARTITAGAGVTVVNGDGVAGNPTVSIGQAVATTDSPQFAGVNVGHATNTTITQLAAGRLGVEGVELARLGVVNAAAMIAAAFRSAETQALADDAAVSVAIPSGSMNSCGVLAVWSTSAVLFGLYHFRADGTVFHTAISEGGSTTSENAARTGMDGVDGSFNIGFKNGFIDFENRIGGAMNFRYLLIM